VAGSGLEWAPSGKQIFIGSDDISILDADISKILKTFGHTGCSENILKLSPDGMRLLEFLETPEQLC
jgi:hypothetical protein